MRFTHSIARDAGDAREQVTNIAEGDDHGVGEVGEDGHHPSYLRILVLGLLGLRMVSRVFYHTSTHDQTIDETWERRRPRGWLRGEIFEEDRGRLGRLGQLGLETSLGGSYVSTNKK